MSPIINVRVIKSLVKPILQPKPPKRLSRNFRAIAETGRNEIEASLKRHYFSRPVAGGALTGEAYLSTPEGKQDFLDESMNRLLEFRRTVIPWLDDARPLKAANILEIGCGAGSSTIALAEQGANVTAVDIDAESIQVARERCKVYGLNADFHQVNATEAHQVFAQKKFDFIIFFAALEHMLHKERLSAIQNTWDMLPPGGLWCVIDTPNRLWHTDGHTSWLPFYTWLPDDLAFLYSKYSSRQPFRDSFRERTDQAMVDFLRQGRGVSYHEFDLGMKKVEELDVVSSLRIWRREKSWLWNLGRRFTLDHRYESMLAEIGPKIYRGFYQATLDLIIRKHG